MFRLLEVRGVAESVSSVTFLLDRLTIGILMRELRRFNRGRNEGIFADDLGRLVDLFESTSSIVPSEVPGTLLID